MKQPLPYKILGLGLFYGLLTVASVFVMTDKGLSPDSHGYLDSALSLAQGEGYQFKGSWNSLWPMGYSLCIAFFYTLLPLSVLWASKLVNLLALFALLFFLQKRYQQRGWMVALPVGYVCKMAAYTWSETLFITLVTMATYALYDQLKQSRFSISFYTLSLGVFLVRYIGGFIGLFTGLLSIYYLWKKDYRLARICFLQTLGLGMAYGLYFGLNAYQGSLIWGGPRFVETEPWHEVLMSALPGLVNEFILLREAPLPDPFAIAGLGIQAGLLLWIARIYKSELSGISNSLSASKLVLLIAFFYSLLIIFLRILSPFDPLTYRLLAPGTILVCIAGLDWLSDPSRSALWKRIQIPVTVFFLIASVSNLLPKDLVKLHTLIQLITPFYN